MRTPGSGHLRFRPTWARLIPNNTFLLLDAVISLRRDAEWTSVGCKMREAWLLNLNQRQALWRNGEREAPMVEVTILGRTWFGSLLKRGNLRE